MGISGWYIIYQTLSQIYVGGAGMRVYIVYSNSIQEIILKYCTCVSL